MKFDFNACCGRTMTENERRVALFDPPDTIEISIQISNQILELNPAIAIMRMPRTAGLKDPEQRDDPHVTIVKISSVLSFLRHIHCSLQA